MNERLKAIIEKHNFDSVADYIDCEAMSIASFDIADFFGVE